MAEDSERRLALAEIESHRWILKAIAAPAAFAVTWRFPTQVGSDTIRNSSSIVPRRIPGLSSNPLDLNPQRMLLGLGHQQDLALLLFGDLKGVGARNALTLRMDGQGQGQSI